MSTLESTDPELPEIEIQNPNRYAEVGARRLRPWLERLVSSLAPEAGSLGVRFMVVVPPLHTGTRVSRFLQLFKIITVPKIRLTTKMDFIA